MLFFSLQAKRNLKKIQKYFDQENYFFLPFRQKKLILEWKILKF